jgi:hypothetical protein
MAPRFLTILTGRNLPNIRQAREPAPSTINEKTIADFHARGRANGNSPRPDDARFRTAPAAMPPVRASQLRDGGLAR